MGIFMWRLYAVASNIENGVESRPAEVQNNRHGIEIGAAQDRIYSGPTVSLVIGDIKVYSRGQRGPL